MALDTAAKRHSALYFLRPWLAPLLPDGSLTQADRQTASDSYGGILATPMLQMGKEQDDIIIGFFFNYD